MKIDVYILKVNNSVFQGRKKLKKDGIF